MFNEIWVKEEVSKILEIEGNTELTTDQLLAELIKHSLKMLTFLARLNRAFGKNPDILTFIKQPTFEVLQSSLS
jgi:hypothetical protein